MLIRLFILRVVLVDGGLIYDYLMLLATIVTATSSLLLLSLPLHFRSVVATTMGTMATTAIYLLLLFLLLILLRVVLQFY